MIDEWCEYLRRRSLRRSCPEGRWRHPQMGPILCEFMCFPTEGYIDLFGAQLLCSRWLAHCKGARLAEHIFVVEKTCAAWSLGAGQQNSSRACILGVPSTPTHGGGIAGRTIGQDRKRASCQMAAAPSPDSPTNGLMLDVSAQYQSTSS